ncbi:MAG: helix-turn-helix domain-containing protein [Sphaerochaetaceae bacterium]|nr:helix-turn-helix domain-containing protein [Sphaerochaetaceae bacterium]
MTFPAQPNQSILRGFDILQEVIVAGHPIGSREVARNLEMEHSSVNRILGTLAVTGILQQNKEKKYLPGPRIHVLSALSLNASKLIPASLPVLEPIHKLGATVALGTLWRDTVVYFLHARADQDIAQSAGVHESYPADKSIIGTVLSPGGPMSTYEDRPVYGHRAWGARIGDTENIGIAAVLPFDHPLATPVDNMRLMVENAAKAILANLKEKHKSI